MILNLHLSRSVFQQWKKEVSFSVPLFEFHRQPTFLPHCIIFKEFSQTFRLIACTKEKTIFRPIFLMFL